jgi:alanine racemase
VSAARCRVEVDLGAIGDNARRLAAAAAPAELWAVAKADGYGHGAVDAGRAAAAGGARRLGVATLDEARALREAVPEVPVVVLAPLGRGQEADVEGLEVTVSTPGAYERLRDAGARCGVHVKVDTGMGRWGLAAAEALEVARRLASGDAPGLELAGVCSHLATADEDDSTFLELQLERFAQVAASFPPAPRHVANSAATLRAPSARHDAVRCGIALYGVSPFEGDPAADGLRPAMRLTSRVAQVKTLRPGESSGYGRRLVARDQTRIALVPVGYGDGYPRVLSGRSHVLIRGRRRPVAATISMDQLTCVVSDDVEVGDQVVLLGEQDGERVGAEELAARAGTIGYEIVCGLRQRAARSERVVRPA